MTAEEKYNTCTHRPDEKIEIFDGCPCQGKKKLVSKCDKLNILGLEPWHCDNCELYTPRENT